MDKPRGIGADNLGQMGQKGDDVMFGDGLDLINPGDVKGDVLCLPDSLGIGFGDHADRGLRVAGMGLDLKPDLEFGLRGPQGNHVGTGIARDHRGRLFWGTGFP